MTWTAPEITRASPPNVGSERELLEGFLDHHRDTLLMKCAGLDEEQLKRASVEPSGLSLLALVRHISDVEYGWFCNRVDGQQEEDLPFYGPSDDPYADFRDAPQADPEEAFERFRTAVKDAKEAAGRHGLDDTFEHPRHGAMSLRWVYLHMIEEYARHNGHADLLRERIDGSTGE
ncbi:DinB family protein [Glycomyces tenuis]|uniref:DinB family protein n=1 Tax=Glycomyces tenuis TaxID=58116 RepID=UPI00047EC018|nr:DinB family protein [Glycomyces tenuis]